MFLLVVLSLIRSGITGLLQLGSVHGGGGGVAADLHVLVPHSLQALVHQAETDTGLVGQAGAHRDRTANISQIEFRLRVINIKYISNRLICYSSKHSAKLALKSTKNFLYYIDILLLLSATVGHGKIGGKIRRPEPG